MKNDELFDQPIDSSEHSIERYHWWCIHPHSFCARCGYAAFVEHKKWARVAVKIIDWLCKPHGENHCYEEYVKQFKK